MLKNGVSKVCFSWYNKFSTTLEKLVFLSAISFVNLRKKNFFLLLCVSAKHSSNSTLIATPYGKFPKDCVHVAEENDAFIKPVEGGVWAIYRSGRRVFHPELPHCVENLKKIRQSRPKGLQILTEWEDYASATMPEQMGVFTAEYTLPSASPDANGGELLYFFIGMQNDAQADVTIIQPVVSFCAESSRCDAGQEREPKTLSFVYVIFF
ncbi:hypothetical protein RFI_01500 [Reticulomyxa filosa]|uniref:Uncharacterized protein n=1 Tax=Reticulomyxa filosa TaxID=46433 RepID=X6PBJ9_RETFI|nr:hypothetical protein RFI_01500 [Reticulomyxa filosa]|eukprot:ETO35566.1 hypothetical protein RFI_01500 [Reticulomyxa filosa]